MSISTTTRRFATAVSLGVVLSLTPLAVGGSSVYAERPAVVVTGLSRGSRGEAVKSVQQALVDQGVAVAGGVDGIFGPGTEAALKEFQAQAGLTASGEVDDATAIALGLASSSYLGLGRGARGDAVRSLQQRLVDAGIDVAGGVDGIFGPGTAAALQDFRSSRGIATSGAVDAATAAALGGVEAAPRTSDSGSSDEPPAAESASPLAGLKIGSRGDAVVQLQRTLMDAGFTVVGGADGIFGALTSNALRSFQNANGVEATGEVDTATAAALAAVSHDDDGHDHSPTVTNPFDGLRYGSQGADVKSLQNALIAAGFRPRGGADGVFGRATEASVARFQASQGLPETGTVDADTASALSSGADASGGSSLTGLKAGALGNTVKSLQQALIDAGIDVRGGADGIFGPATANAVKSFQRSQGLEATGVVDDATAAALANPASPSEPASSTAGGFAVYGEKGERVMALQSALVDAGIVVRGGVDGQFGGGTSAAVMEFQRQRGLSVTGKVSDATAEQLGLERLPAPAAPDPASVSFDVFPVQGKCYYGDTWGYPRSGGRVHLGVDIIGTTGNLLYAVADGTITKVYADYPGSLAGNGVRLTMDDGTYFFYAHMSEVADGIDVGTKVVAGQIVGALGNTGSSGTPHLHFEVHPKGGSAVNPYPLVKAIDGCNDTEPLPQP